jgi:putative hemolysin
VIFIANHPTGLLDGILLIDLLSKARPDVKFMGNFLLDRIESLKHYFISVDPFDSKDSKKNMRGIREALRHVQAGGALVIFPAGEVATWQKGFNEIKDRRWPASIIRFIRSVDMPVVPVCIEARNSRFFRLVGLIHPILRTILLPRQLLNKRGETININVGSAILPRKVKHLEKIDAYGDYMRANVDYLHKKIPRKKLLRKRRKPLLPRKPAEIASALDPVSVAAELATIHHTHLLFEQANYDVYCAHPDLIPSIMYEIGRLREVTFRSIGEGTGKSIDTDFYDTYYHQLFIWDRDAQQIIGAYRLGMGDEIMPRFGLNGFYVNSLFKMKPEMEHIMDKTIELGRSFIVEEYQRKPASLLMLWKGILYVLLKHEQYRNLLGPVTISGEFDKYSKTVIVAHLRQQHLNRVVARWVKPITGLEGINAPLDESLIAGVDDIGLIDKIVRDIERDELSIPILIKKYLQLNSHVLAFNVDHDFADALDALMLLDLKAMPETTINMLSKEITDIDVVTRFRNYHPEL